MAEERQVAEMAEEVLAEVKGAVVATRVALKEVVAHTVAAPRSNSPQTRSCDPSLVHHS